MMGHKYKNQGSLLPVLIKVCALYDFYKGELRFCLLFVKVVGSNPVKHGLGRGGLPSLALPEKLKA